MEKGGQFNQEQKLVILESAKVVRFENEGRKAAWFIHGVDKLLAGKKTLRWSRKSLCGSVYP